MCRILCRLAPALALAALLSASAGQASAQGCFAPAPVVSYYYAPQPVVSYYQPAPVVPVYRAPVVSYYAPPAPVVSYYAPAPVYVAPPVAVSTTYRYGLFGLRRATYTNYYTPAVVYP